MSWLLALLFTAGAELPQWTLLESDSTLGFTAEYDGSPFDGEFHDFTVAMGFDPGSPSAVVLQVEVDVTTVDTENRDRDEALAEAEWFDFAAHPRAVYRADAITAGEERQFRLDGELTLKGITRALPVEFDWSMADGAIRVEGTAHMVGGARMNRMDHDIGTGDWSDPELIGHEVVVSFDLKLTQTGVGGLESGAGRSEDQSTRN